MGRRRKQPMTALDYEMRARLAGLTNVLKHGGKAAIAPAQLGLKNKDRLEAIAHGAVSEEDIQQRCAALRRLRSIRAIRARWAKRDAELAAAIGERSTRGEDLPPVSALDLTSGS